MRWAMLISQAGVRAAVLGLALSLTALRVAFAQPAAPEPTAISIGAPATVELGEVITLQARLVDSSGGPVAKATVLFTTHTSFLNVEGDVVVAQATTDKQGLASAHWQVRRSGTVPTRAQFPGNESYAASEAVAQIRVTGDKQLYVQDPGVQIPGLTTGPAFGQVPGSSPLWAILSGSPIGMILLVVWSLYGLVAVLLFRVAAAGTDTPAPPAVLGIHGDPFARPAFQQDASGQESARSEESGFGP